MPLGMSKRFPTSSSLKWEDLPQMRTATFHELVSQAARKIKSKLKTSFHLSLLPDCV